VAGHLDYAAVLAYLGFLVGLVGFASLEHSLFAAVIASQDSTFSGPKAFLDSLGFVTPSNHF